jgi:hypothetical protein
MAHYIGPGSPDWRELMRSEIRASRKFGNNEPITEKQDTGVLDPRDVFKKAPLYTPGMLPQLYEDYVSDNIGAWGGDKAAYAVGFLAMHCAVLHASVKVQTNPKKHDVWRNPNDFALVVGKSGDNKSGLWRDLTRHQRDWQSAMTRAQSTMTRTRTSGIPTMAFLQNCSVEGMMNQIVDNRGERLCIGSEEAMDFYGSAGAHRGESAISAMSNAVCAAYDGGVYSKRLVGKLITVPEALGTLIMVTVDDNIAGWKDLGAMISSGLMARHTIGMITRPEPRNHDMLVPDADKRMSEFMIKLRGLRDVRLMIAPDAQARWFDYIEQREGMNKNMAELKESPGLLAYCRKYDLRVMSLATIFQLYEFIEGGQLAFLPQEVDAPETADHDKLGKKVIKLVDISLENMKRAVNFFEKFLIPTQDHFYKSVEGASEFSMELINFLSYHITNDDRGNPNYRDLSRNDLTYRGPTSMRGAVTDARKLRHKRWIRALLDHGFIEVWDKPGARPLKRAREEDEMQWYRIRLELYEHFKDDASLKWLQQHDQAVKVQMARNGIGPNRIILEL